VFWNGCGKKQQCKFRKSRRIIELGWNRERLKIEYLVSGQAIKKEQSKDTKRGAHRNDEGQPQERLFFYDGLYVSAQSTYQQLIKQKSPRSGSVFVHQILSVLRRCRFSIFALHRKPYRTTPVKTLRKKYKDVKRKNE
jgi:hypothetical protein